MKNFEYDWELELKCSPVEKRTSVQQRVVAKLDEVNNGVGRRKRFFSFKPVALIITVLSLASAIGFAGVVMYDNAEQEQMAANTGVAEDVNEKIAINQTVKEKNLQLYKVKELSKPEAVKRRQLEQGIIAARAAFQDIADKVYKDKPDYAEAYQITMQKISMLDQLEQEYKEKNVSIDDLLVKLDQIWQIKAE